MAFVTAACGDDEEEVASSLGTTPTDSGDSDAAGDSTSPDSATTNPDDSGESDPTNGNDPPLDT